MAKKHWIYIKRGLSEDPKHRAQMGECIWLYMHIIDRADWETGVAYDWKDKEEAADMGMPVDTLRRQRQKLEEMDYVRCSQKQHSQDVRIMEWKNPRDYSAEVKNPRNEGSHEQPPSDFQGLNQGLNQGSNQVPRQVKTPTLYSKSKSESGGAKAPYRTFSDAVLEKRRKMGLLVEKIESLLGVKPDLKKKQWERTVNAILNFEEEGKTVEGFAKWLKAGNDYNRPKTFQISRDPEQLISIWASAFVDAVKKAEKIITEPDWMEEMTKRAERANA